MAYATYTRADLRLSLQEKYESVPFWTTPEANNAINESLRMWNLLTGRWKRRITLTTAPGDYDLALPSTLLYRTRVLFNGLPLTPSSYTDLSAGRPNWRSETTLSGGDVPTRPTVWIPISLYWIQIWPADALGHNGITVDGVSATPILTADGDFVDLPLADLNALLWYALHALTLKKGGVWFAATMRYYREFLQAAGEQNQILTTSETFRKWAGVDRRDMKPIQLESAPAGIGMLTQQSRQGGNSQ